ncbi:sugar phosphate isomerase/epimerase family protein [Arthrobacter sp. TE12232]
MSSGTGQSSRTGLGSNSSQGSRIGLSSYAFFWQLSDRVSAPLNLHEALAETAALGVDLFQICDYAQLEAMTDADLASVRATADALGIALELGTKGIRPEHLRKFLRIAGILGAPLLRTMFNVPGHTPDADETVAIFTGVLPDFEAAGVRIAVETYEQVPTSRVLDVIARVDSPYLGICSDPANTVAALESPREVIDAVAPYVLNMHIKDFAFSRKEGWVGFTYSGAPLGEGLLDYAYMARKLQPKERNINQIIEHWLPWQASEEETIRLEKQWTQQSLDFLRRN